MASSHTDTVPDSVGTAEEPSILRCRKCRRCVADSTCLLLASKEFMATCSVWHVDVETLPDWILKIINQVHWTVGKLNCQYCGARLGGFNFINCPKCPCGHNSAVHLSKSRVDQAVKHSVHLSRPGRARRHAEIQAGFLGNPKELEEPKVRGNLESIPNLNQDLHQVIQMLKSETELQSMATQVTHLDGEASFISLCSRTPDLPHISPVDEDVTETVAIVDSGQEPQSLVSLETDNEGPEAHERQMPVQTSGYQENTEGHLVYFTPQEMPSMETELEQEQENIIPGTTEEQMHHTTSSPVQNLTKKEKNRLKSLRRKQRKKARWIQSQIEEKSVKWNLTSSDDEEKEGYTCAVCLDVYYNPYMCQPCSHVFCEPCLRTVAKNRPSSTPCPLCRTLISHVLFQQELHQTTRTYFPKEYLSRKETFQKTNYSKWPLPSCPKRFRILWGFQRRGAFTSRWQFPHRAFGLDGLELGDMRGWPFDSDIVIVSIYSFHWVLAFILFCGLFYFFLF
ncbi:E3 ubiquitin-protein ligase RNF180 isoform X1 [Colossoma macropomum]|uniref:E3 ubiquitin-protein ligase RNF180 isoform X1 n=2 Tax=Colossoma macropomum TaxID=42526 RepID=UPI001864115A|nr:E3 ubiquitin-protein ligase RNF180 isoform X1 [Colossoma macropomum]